MFFPEFPVCPNAIAEIAALSAGTIYREKILELFASLQANLEASTDKDSDELELLMSLTQSPAFVEFVDRIRSDGKKEERQSIVESLLVSRFNSLDAELFAIIPNIIQLPPSEFTPLLLKLSREELLTKFS